MVGLCACQSIRQNPPPTGKDELAGATPTYGSGTPTQAPAIAHSPIPYFIKMAGTCACSSPRQNPSMVKHGNDEPVEQASGASINSSGFCALTFIPLYHYCILLRFSLQ